jgi:hypothetical protein
VSVAVSGTAFGSSGVLTGLSDTTCQTRGGYNDVGVGMQAVIKDPAGTIIGFATFTKVGQSTETEQGPVGRVPTECTFTVLVEDVPDATSYDIEAGDRGSVLFSRSELAANGWVAEMTLGR